MHEVTLDRGLLDRAASIAPGTVLRSLDAIHLASTELAVDLRAVVTYDRRLAAAARSSGLPVASP